MLVTRSGNTPRIAGTATVAASAIIVGDVTVRGCYVDHGVIIESSGPPITISHDVAIFAGAVLRSVGGESRPAFPLNVGDRTLIGPQCSLLVAQLEGAATWRPE
jgi:carbonic anhydrase/acetyltransferase-like protein (isoleucine patch superfamily)